MTYGTRTCLECGKEFEATYPGQITCSDKCRTVRKETGMRQGNAAYRQRIRERMARLAELERTLALLERENAELRARLSLCGVAG